MFTGIIRKLSKVHEARMDKGSLFVTIENAKGWKFRPGDSVAVNGVCSTVKVLAKKGFVVEYMPETMKKTTVENFTKGTEVNLEKSLSLKDLLDGHLVQGHVDTRGKIIKITEEKNSKVMRISVPSAFMKFIASKGSIAVDGISLTVVDTGKNWFSVSLVDYTLANTNLGKLEEGAWVNIETDVVAKYLANFLTRHRRIKG